MWICHIYICVYVYKYRYLFVYLFIVYLCIYLCIGLLLDKYDHDFLRRHNVDCGLECGNSTIWRSSFSDWWIIAISRCLNHFLTLRLKLSAFHIAIFLCSSAQGSFLLLFSSVSVRWRTQHSTDAAASQLQKNMGSPSWISPDLDDFWGPY